MYKVLGFKFDLTPNELSYENLYKAIELGPLFTNICEIFNLDEIEAGKYVKEFAFHQLKEEALNLDDSEVSLIFRYQDEPIGQTTFGDIIDQAFFSIDEEYIGMMEQEFLNIVKKRSGKSFDSKDKLKLDEAARDAYAQNINFTMDKFNYLRKSASI